MFSHFGIRRRRPAVKTFNVITLDGNTLTFNIDGRSNGKELLDKVLQECGITADKIYFSLATQEANYLRWILLHKPLKKQLSGHSPYTILFRVYIYPYNHHSLLQSLSRHYLYLQIKRDLQSNNLQPSSPATTNHIAALIVQGEIGNFIPQTCSNGYIRDLQILPNMTTGMEEAIKQAHRLNRGRLPGECEEEALDLVQDEPTYGSVYYNIQDAFRQPVTVCVCPVGVRVAQGGRQINCLKWESITKATNRGKHVYFSVDASQTLTAYQAHYVCTNSQMAGNLVHWCQALIRFYCSMAQEDPDTTKSRLKRFFSSRMSLRRRPNVNGRQQYSHPGSIPVPRRNRRASVGSEILISPRRGSLSSTKTDSKLVIYGLSGLASTQNLNQTTPTNNSTTSLSSPVQNNASQVCNSPIDTITTNSSEVSEDPPEKSDLHHNISTSPLHVIQEDENTLGGNDSTALGMGMNEFGIGRGGSSLTVGSELKESLKGSKRGSLDGSYCGEKDESYQRGSRGSSENHHRGSSRASPAQGSASDLEHKSITAMLQQRKPPLGSCNDDPSSTSTPLPPPIPARNHSKTELETLGEYSSQPRRGSYDQHRSSEQNGSGSYSFHKESAESGQSGYKQAHRSHLESNQNRREVSLSPHSRSGSYSTPQLHSPTHHNRHHSPSPRNLSPSSHYHHHHHHHRRSDHHHHRSHSPHHHYQRHTSEQQNRTHSPYHHYRRSSEEQSDRTHSPHYNYQRSSDQDRTHSPYHHYQRSSEQSDRTHSPYHHQRSSEQSDRTHSPYRRSSDQQQDRTHSPHNRSSHQLHSASNSSMYSSGRHWSFANSSSQLPRGRDPQSKTNNWQEGSGRSDSGSDQPSFDNHVTNGHSHPDFNDRRYDYQYKRRHSHDDAIPSDRSKQEKCKSPASAGIVERRHFRYPTTSSELQSNHHQQNGEWYEEEMAPQQGSSSLPLQSNHNYSLYEEDEDMEEDEGSLRASGKERKSIHDPSMLEGSRHVSRHKRLRHSTITSLISLSSQYSDITGGLSRLGSIASLDYKASLAELSQTDSMGGCYIDPHVRSMVFESQNSQGTEL